MASDVGNNVEVIGYLAKAQSMAVRGKVTQHEPGDLLDSKDDPEEGL